MYSRTFPGFIQYKLPNSVYSGICVLIAADIHLKGGGCYKMGNITGDSKEKALIRGKITQNGVV